MESSGSGGAEEPSEGNRSQEPAATSPSSNGNGAPTAVPPPPPPPPPPRRRKQPGGGAPADGSSPSAAAADPKGKQIALPTPPSSSGSSADYGAAFGDGAFEAGESSGRKRVTWSEPVVVGTTEVPAEARAGPRAPPQSLESKQVFEQMVLKQLVLEQLLREHAALHKDDDDSLETLPQIKERPEQEKLPHVKCISVWSHLKNKIFHRERREICSEHVAHQTHPITEVRRLYKIPLNTANHLDAYSECRAVTGDGDCFYRSFIYSYLEQVIDRQDTEEERRLLDVVKRVSTQHANLRWISEFPSSSRVFKKLIKKVLKWKRHGRSNSMESTSSYRKEKLLMFFSEYYKTEYIYIFLRLVVAIHMCSHKEVYEPLIPGLKRDYTLEDWCCRRVTPARRMTDDIMMRALATVFDVPLRVETFEEGYARDIYTGSGARRASVTLLYTGEHYDIIYRRAPAESSGHQAS